MRIVVFPAVGVYGGFREGDRPGDVEGVQVFGRYILSAVYCALPIHVSLLFVGVEERFDVPGVFAGGCRGLCGEYPARLFIPEGV